MQPRVVKRKMFASFTLSEQLSASQAEDLNLKNDFLRLKKPEPAQGLNL